MLRFIIRFVIKIFKKIMKNLQKGFIVPALLVIITLLVVGGSFYVYKNKKSEAPAVVDTGIQQTNTQTPPATNQQNPVNNKPVNVVPTTDTAKPIITSISQSSGPIGTVVELKGYNLLENRGDQNLIIENSKGEVASFGFGNPEHLKLSEKYVSMKFNLSEKVCKQWGTDMGGPCTKGWMTIVPGEYKIYVAINGFTDTSAMSNKVAFTITQPNASELNTVTHHDSGITFKYPKDWKFDAGKNYFTTSDYQEGKSGARIEFVYGLSGNDWRGTIAAMYGSNSLNNLVLINGKSVLQTTYPNAVDTNHLIGLSLPFANNTAFVSLLLRYEASGRLEASYKESYKPVLEKIVENMILPSTLTSEWHVYINNKHNFSFSHPPLTSVISDGTYFKNSVASYLAMVRYGFHQLLFVFTKPTDQLLKTWYDNTFAGMNPARGPIEKTINSYSAIDVTFNDMDIAGRHIMVAKNGVVVDFLFSNATIDSPLTSDQQKLLDSFLFR